MVKLILKNIMPCLASQLCERVHNVEDLVSLGTQFEKDWEHHLQTQTCVPSSRYPNRDEGTGGFNHLMGFCLRTKAKVQ